MARIVLTDAKVTINSVNLSSLITSVTMTTSVDVVETTAFGATGAAKTRVAGLVDNSVSFEFQQDFAASMTEATIFPLIGNATTIVIQPTSAAVSATNPSYTFSAIVTEWPSVSGTVGELATATASWPITGVITKAVV